MTDFPDLNSRVAGFSLIIICHQATGIYCALAVLSAVLINEKRKSLSSLTYVFLETVETKWNNRLNAQNVRLS